MEFTVILIKSIIIGGLLGFSASMGAARMFHAPSTQGLGAFRTLGEMNACMGDPASHFLIWIRLFLQRLGFDCWSRRIYTGCYASDYSQLGSFGLISEK